MTNSMKKVAIVEVLLSSDIVFSTIMKNKCLIYEEIIIVCYVKASQIETAVAIRALNVYFDQILQYYFSDISPNFLSHNFKLWNECESHFVSIEFQITFSHRWIQTDI